MSNIDDAIDEVRDRAVDLLNSEGRSAGHVAAGVVVTVGFALLATAFATGVIGPHKRPLKALRHGAAPITERPRGAFSLVLPAVFSATTLSAVRVWNAPQRPERTSAMTLWFAAQAVNAVWLAVRPSTRNLQIAAAMSSAGLAAAFAHEARKLDDGAGKLASPTGGGVRFGNFLHRKADQAERTLH